MTMTISRPGRRSVLLEIYGSTVTPASCDSALTSEMYSELTTFRGWPSTKTVNSADRRSGTGLPCPSTTETSTSSTSTPDRKTGVCGACAARPARQHAVNATDRLTVARMGNSPRKDALYLNEHIRGTDRCGG